MAPFGPVAVQASAVGFPGHNRRVIRRACLLDERIERIVRGRRTRREERREFLQTELGRRGAEYHRKHPEAALGHGGFFHVNLPAAVRALPEDREYREKEITRLISRVNRDCSLTRRRLYEKGWMMRTGDRYRLTDRGRHAWRMERLLAAATL